MNLNCLHKKDQHTHPQQTSGCGSSVRGLAILMTTRGITNVSGFGSCGRGWGQWFLAFVSVDHDLHSEDLQQYSPEHHQYC
jgi:hypothetical protein